MNKYIFLATLMLTILAGCSGGQKDAATAVFIIEDVFNISDKGIVVAGEMLDGVIRVGDKIAYYNKEGKKLTYCTVKAIEQPPHTDLQEASVDAERKHFAFSFVEYKTKSHFSGGGFFANGDYLKWKENRE